MSINKYSINAIKGSIDDLISEYLFQLHYKEDLFLNNLKIFLSLFSIISAIISHFYFPENYNIALFIVLSYILIRLIYFIIDNYFIKSIFYIGTNESFFKKLKIKKKSKYCIKKLKVHSKMEIKCPNIYEVWFEFEFDFLNEKKSFFSKKRKIDVTKVIDLKGSIYEFYIIHAFKSILKKEISKIK